MRRKDSDFFSIHKSFSEILENWFITLCHNSFTEEDNRGLFCYFYNYLLPLCYEKVYRNSSNTICPLW